MSCRWGSVFLVFVAMLGLASGASAAPILYGDYIGLNPGDVDFLQVREDSVTDPPPLFEAPFFLPNKLIFTPISFVSYAANGSADTTSGTLQMRIRADAGTFLTTITITEAGGYTLVPAGLGSPATSTTINGLLTLTDINPGTYGVFTDPLDITPNAPYFLPGDSDGEFVAITSIDLTGLGIREVILNFNNNLQTSSEQGTTALIQKTNITIYTPEPASLALLAVGGLLLIRRRR